MKNALLYIPGDLEIQNYENCELKNKTKIDKIYNTL